LSDPQFGVFERLDEGTGTRAPSRQMVQAAPPANQPVPAPAKPVPTGNVPENLKAGLKRVRSAYNDGGIGSQEFQDSLQSIATELAEVPVATDSPARWTRLVLNAAKMGIDAFRFHCQLDQPADMSWAFTDSRSVSRWYILPARGTMHGFADYT